MLEEELEQKERIGQNKVDNKIFIVCCILLFVLLCNNHIFKTSDLSIFTIISLSITLISSICSDYYSSQTFRKFNEQQHYNLHTKFNINKSSYHIHLLNLIQLYAFISTIISINIFLRHC